VNRSASLDALRGLTVAGMILVNNPGSWSHIYPPLAHAAWHGCTPTDLVFPFFLFVVGCSMAFALRADAPANEFWPKVLRRAALIFLIGLFLNASPFVRWNEAGELVLRDPNALRIMGVLQRIALAYLGAAIVVRWVGVRAAWKAALVLLLLYWAACLLFAQGSDPYNLEGFFGTRIDRAVLGDRHLYHGEGVPFDPEGLVSTWPAVAQVLLGVAVGRWLQRGPLDGTLVKRLLITAAVLLMLAFVWQFAMPFNKKIWTSSYVLLTTGWALLLLAALIRRLDLRAHRAAWVTWAAAFGRNALLLFFLAGFLPRVLALLRWKSGEAWTSPLLWLQKNFMAFPLEPRIGSLAYALAVLATFSALALWLDRKRWYFSV
jgi:predicted acyltransferase